MHTKMIAHKPASKKVPINRNSGADISFPVIEETYRIGHMSGIN